MDTNNPIPKYLRLSSRQQSRELDRQTIEEFGIDGFTLMEIAGAKAASFIHQKTGNSKKGLYFCGTGNNAGDALVAARYLADRHNHSVTILFISGSKNLSKDAEKNLSLLKKLPQTRVSILEQANKSEGKEFDYVVDGLIGTGLSRKLESPYTEAVEEIGQCEAPVFSLDIPTGLDADSGNIHGAAVQADYTITFGTNKTGFYLNHGPDHTGEIEFIELPFPSHLHKNDAVLITEELQNYLEPVKRVARHKYESGTVHILAGSEGLTGAAIMAAKAAWKSGAGAVFLYAPKKLLPVYEQTLPEIIKISLGNNSDEFYKPDHATTILENLKKRPGVVVAGPGTGKSSQTIDLLAEVITKCNLPVLLDADGLSCWDKIKGSVPANNQNILLTPHPGELKNYLGIDAADDSDRIKKLRETVKNENVSILSKGSPTALINTRGELFITGYDTKAFSRAGFGDLLAGTISAYWTVTNSLTDSTLHAMIDGYKTYKKQNYNHSFEPVDLL